MENRSILPTLYMWIPKIINQVCTLMNQQHLEKYIIDFIVTVTNCTVAIPKDIYTTNSITYYENKWIFGMNKSSYPFFLFFSSFFLFLPADRHYVNYGGFSFHRLLNTKFAHKSCLQHRLIIVTIILWWRASGGAVLPIWTKSSHSNHSHILIASVTVNLYLI